MKSKIYTTNWLKERAREKCPTQGLLTSGKQSYVKKHSVGARKAPNGFLESLRGRAEVNKKLKNIAKVELVSQQSVGLENPQASELKKKSEAVADA